MRRRWRRLLAALLAAPLALACAGLHGEREACYAQADAYVQREAYGPRCPGKWSTCEARPSVLAEAARMRRACR